MKARHTVLTLSKIRGRCERVGDCLLWTQATNTQGIPYAAHGGRVTNIRRLAFELHDQAALPAELKVVMRCGNSGCLNRGHMLALTKSKIMERVAASGKLSTPSIHASKLAAAYRRPSNKLTPALAIEIRNAPGTQKERAERYGVSRSTVALIDQRKSWKLSGVAGSSVFNMVPA